MSANLPRLWLDKAQEDLTVARILHKEAIYAQVCFHAQQCIEKVLKAYLLAKTGTYSRTHGLIDLLSQCNTLDPTVSRFASDCAKVEQYYIPVRYPDSTPGGGGIMTPLPNDAEHALKSADEILGYIANQLFPAVSSTTT